MPQFRYSQLCPVARAAEVLGERWTLLIIRELLPGPKRFADIQASLGKVSTSVLASRLSDLEDNGLAERVQLPPPGDRQLYGLTDLGKQLFPVIRQMARWGVRLLDRSLETDMFQPGWIVPATHALARTDESPQISVLVRFREDLPALDELEKLEELKELQEGDTPPLTAEKQAAIPSPDRHREAAKVSGMPPDLLLEGGPGGTRIHTDPDRARSAGGIDATVETSPRDALSMIAGLLRPDVAAASGRARISGDTEAAGRIALLFDAGLLAGGPPTGTPA